jgi:hypothetical protein
MRAIVALLVASAATGLTATHAPAYRSVMEDDRTLLRSGPTARNAALDDMRELGVDTVRVLVVWRDYAPDPGRIRAPRFDAADPAAYPAQAWTGLDGLVGAAAARGLDLILTPTGPGPAWASRCRGPAPTRGVCRPDPGDFGGFVEALGRRYPTQQHWAVWNEPNAAPWLAPQFVGGPHGRRKPVAPGVYRALVSAAATALRASGHAGDELLIGETAPVGPLAGGSHPRFTSPAGFARALLCDTHPRECPTIAATGWAQHVYTRGTALSPCRDRGRPLLRSLGRLRTILDRAARRGVLARRLPILMTEAGFQTSPPDPLFGVPLAAQAADLNALEFLAVRRAHLGSFAQYLLFDEVPRPRFQSGLRFADGASKPAYDAYRMPVWLRPSKSGAALWGRVRPAGAGERVALERRRGSGPWRTVRVLRTRGAAATVTARLPVTTGAWRLRWPVSGAGTLLSRSARAASC